MLPSRTVHFIIRFPCRHSPYVLHPCDLLKSLMPGLNTTTKYYRLLTQPLLRILGRPKLTAGIYHYMRLLRSSRLGT
jgi:hypothetical protein